MQDDKLLDIIVADDPVTVFGSYVDDPGLVFSCSLSSEPIQRLVKPHGYVTEHQTN